MALRLTIALAVAGQILVVLGILGLLQAWVLVMLGVLILGERVHAEMGRSGGVSAFLRLSPSPRETVLLIPLALLALYPPIAFDETLYHLPFVRAIANSGAINYFADIRFPAFPQLHELLCVPVFLLLGDTATHFVAVAEVVLVVGLLIAWPKERAAGILAAALVLGNPIVMQIGSVTYVDAALMLFVNGLLVGTAIMVGGVGFQSMLADTADEHEWLFGVRREGLFFSGLTLAYKGSAALGGLIAGVALDLIRFPTDLAARDPAAAIPPEILAKLGLIAGPLPAAFAAAAPLFLFGYHLTRKKHERIIAELEERHAWRAATTA